uniref:Putative guanylate-binding protein n=1 Tax=Amblyomma aureolatum TaxID=187763 RepID=A0A1E1X6M8_9ACAR
MADRESSGEPVAIFSAKDNGSFHLDSKALERILLADHVRDKPVVVVSMAGAFRKGKSFLLNFFIRYLRNQCRSDWLKESDAPLDGISWRGGSERDATGILVWSEVFLVTTPQGEELAVLLMDTQGSYDNVSTIDECTTTFALSTMLSSVLIYTLSENIQQNDIQHLQLFCDYAYLAQKEVHGTPFQNLLILVRDWCCLREAGYGKQGGCMMVHRWLETSRDQDWLKGLRRDIHDCFDDISGFLMPHPGLKVATEPEFEGRLSKMDAAFKEQLEKLVPLILEPGHVAPKRVNGREITCEQLKTLFEVSSGEFCRGTLPSPTSLRQATGVETNLAATKNALEHYELLMDEHCSDGYLSPDLLITAHEKQRAAALNLFDRMVKLGGRDLAGHYRRNLLQEIQIMYKRYVRRNLNKKSDCTLM